MYRRLSGTSVCMTDNAMEDMDRTQQEREAETDKRLEQVGKGEGADEGGREAAPDEDDPEAD